MFHRYIEKLIVDSAKELMFLSLPIVCSFESTDVSKILAITFFNHRKDSGHKVFETSCCLKEIQDDSDVRRDTLFAVFCQFDFLDLNLHTICRNYFI